MEAQREWKKIVGTLRSHGKRMTPIRRTLLECMLSSSSPIRVKDLFQYVREQGKTVDKVTIYRQMETLVACGVLRESDVERSSRYYELRGDHHHHFSCQKCEGVECIDIEPLMNGIDRVEKALAGSGHDVTGHKMMFFGFCRKCRKKRL